MSAVAFDLAPFPGQPAPEGVAIAGAASRAGGVLTLRWRLTAPEGAVAMDAPAPPERRFGLWEATCFEFFLASPGRPGYWEFNLAPAGHWNAYRLAGYRAGMVEEPAFAALPFAVSREPGACEVVVEADLAGLGLAAPPWRLAVATVVVGPDGGTSFWALAHPGAEPDFHDPDAFRIALPGS